MEETIFVAWMHERGIPVITRSLLVVLCLTLVMSSCQAVGVPVTQETEATTLTAIPSPTTTSSPTPEPLKDIQLLGQIGGSSYAVALQGNYAYLGMGPRLIVLDISDPDTPLFVGQTDVLPDTVRNVVVTENYAYIAAGDSGLRIIDIRDPSAPNEVGFYETPAPAQGIAVLGEYAYVAAGDAGLRIINIAGNYSGIEMKGGQ